MNVLKLSCSSCGAPIQIPTDVDLINCAHCGTALLIQRGDGYVALKLAEQVNKTILETSEQTRAAIESSTQSSQVELRRLQIGQERSSLQMQLSNIQSEIRALERQKQDRQVKNQLKALKDQENELTLRISSLQTYKPETGSTPNRSRSAFRSVMGFLKTPLGRSFMLGFLVYVLVGGTCMALAMPLDKALFNNAPTITSGYTPGTLSYGPLGVVGAVFGLACGVVTFLDRRNPDRGLWRSIWARLKQGFRR